MMEQVQVSGRFVDQDKNPIEGEVSFIPSKIWIEDEDGETYPTLAPEMHLTNGQFLVYLTRTDTAEVRWHYTVRCPLGTWSIWLDGPGPFSLKELLPKKFST